jgi:hypothetical protein
MPPRDYSELDESEQDAVLERHLATAPERLAGFRREAGELELDGTPDSLVAAWEWFLRRNVGSGRPAQAPELPDWYEPDPPELAPQRLPPATLRDVDGIGLYLAEVLRRERPELEWQVGRLPKRMRYALQGKPVLQTPGGFDLDPLGIAYALAVRAVLLGTGREPDALRQAYAANLEALEPR